MAIFRRTLRWHTQSVTQRLQQLQLAHADDATWVAGTSLAFHYLRLPADAAAEIVATFPDVTECDAPAEILELDAGTVPGAMRLAAFLHGAGAPRTIRRVYAEGQRITLEILGDPTLVVHAIDAFMGRELVRRRAVLPLSDTSLLAAAGWMWNVPQLDLLRILEVAAGDGSL